MSRLQGFSANTLVGSEHTYVATFTNVANWAIPIAGGGLPSTHAVRGTFPWAIWSAWLGDVSRKAGGCLVGDWSAGTFPYGDRIPRSHHPVGDVTSTISALQVDVALVCLVRGSCLGGECNGSTGLVYALLANKADCQETAARLNWT